MPTSTLIDLLVASATAHATSSFERLARDLAEVLERHPHVLALLEAADWQHRNRTVHLHLGPTGPDELAAALDLLAAVGVDLEVDVAHLDTGADPQPAWTTARRIA